MCLAKAQKDGFCFTLITDYRITILFIIAILLIRFSRELTIIKALQIRLVILANCLYEFKYRRYIFKHD